MFCKELRRLNIDWLFLCLIAALLIVNIMVKPLHDTNYAFDVFYFFYNEVFFYGELPGWEPFGRYGAQSYFSSNASAGI